MLTGIISKIGLPVLAAILCGFGGYAAGVYQVSSRSLEVKTNCPAPVVNLKCPDPINTIDFDKVKNFKGTLKIDQNYRMEVNADSLFTKKMVDEIVKQNTSSLQNEIAKLKLARCK